MVVRAVLPHRDIKKKRESSIAPHLSCGMPTTKSGHQTSPEDQIVITGAGGFIGGALTRHFHERGFTRIRAIDRKPLHDWYQHIDGTVCLTLDLSEKENAVRAVEGAVEVYNFAADMGGMGFIERFRIECLRSILINTHLIEAAWKAGGSFAFFVLAAGSTVRSAKKDPNVLY